MWEQARDINRLLRERDPKLPALFESAFEKAQDEAFGARQTHVGFLCAPVHEPEIVKIATERKLTLERAPSSVLTQELGVQATILEMTDPDTKRSAEVIFVRSSAAPIMVRLMADLGRAAHWALEVDTKQQIAEVAQKIRNSSAQSWVAPTFSEEPLFSPQKGLWLYYMDDGYARLEITARGA